MVPRIPRLSLAYSNRLALLLLSLLCLRTSASSAEETRETYDERLDIRPLDDGKVLSHFEFTTKSFDGLWQGSEYEQGATVYSTTLLPRSLTAIVRAYDVEEVHLSLTSGRWDYARWGEPIGHGAPSGGEIFAWLSNYQSDTPESIKQKWTGLTNSLGGLFCSSLNNLDDKMTTSPRLAFSPTLSSSAASPFFHTLLPLEKPCTENLTPFIGQLPCRSAAGLAELLSPFKLFDANWQKLAILVVRDVESGELEFKLEFEVVQDPVRMTAGSQPRRDWSFDSLFGRPVRQSCPVAQSSIVTVDLSKEDAEAGYSLEPKASQVQLPADKQAFFDIQSQDKPLNLAMTWPVMHRDGFEYPSTFEPATVLFERINTGYGLERNRLGVQIRNNADQPVSAVWLEAWPHWIKAYMHTMHISVDGLPVETAHVIKKLHYQQAQSRGRPSIIEAGLVLPARSTIRIEVNVEKAYLWYTDYPPDALRGFDVPSGVLLANSTKPRRIYTTSTLLDMPTPDFSMPYNVIIMTCTVMALFFGSVFNLLTRTWMIIDMREPADTDKPTANGSTAEAKTDAIKAPVSSDVAPQ